MSQNSEQGQSSFAALQTHHLSHDLRGPLNSMLGFTELLLDGVEGPLTEFQTEDITAIRQSAVNLLRLINAIVDVGKTDNGLLTLNVQPASMHNALTRAIQNLPADKTDKIKLDIAPNLPTVLADAQRVEEIVFNIFNYLLAKKEVSRVTVTTTATTTGATAAITATGLLLTTEQTAHLFELTVAVDPTGRTKLTEGGLFLPLAQRLAQLQQGSLTVGATGSGAVFQLTLPLVNAN
jgi:signal transduction histidine kinase